MFLFTHLQKIIRRPAGLLLNISLITCKLCKMPRMMYSSQKFLYGTQKIPPRLLPEIPRKKRGSSLIQISFPTLP